MSNQYADFIEKHNEYTEKNQKRKRSNGRKKRKSRMRPIAETRRVHSAEFEVCTSTLVITDSGYAIVVPSNHIPKPKTLQKYGLKLEQWALLYERSQGRCEICHGQTKRLCIDHEHVAGWKKLKPAERSRYVRGLLCWRCNVQIVGRGVTAEKLSNALSYVNGYQSRQKELKVPEGTPEAQQCASVV